MDSNEKGEELKEDAEDPVENIDGSPSERREEPQGPGEVKDNGEELKTDFVGIAEDEKGDPQKKDDNLERDHEEPTVDLDPVADSDDDPSRGSDQSDGVKAVGSVEADLSFITGHGAAKDGSDSVFFIILNGEGGLDFPGIDGYIRLNPRSEPRARNSKNIIAGLEYALEFNLFTRLKPGGRCVILFLEKERILRGRRTVIISDPSSLDDFLKVSFNTMDRTLLHFPDRSDLGDAISDSLGPPENQILFDSGSLTNSPWATALLLAAGSWKARYETNVETYFAHLVVNEEAVEGILPQVVNALASITDI